MLTPDEVRDVSFSAPPIGKRGYDMQQVDAFLDRVEATLRGADDLTAEQVRAVTFAKPPIGRRGYSEDEVDNFLDLAESQLSGRPVPSPPPPPAAPAPPPLPSGTVPGMVRPKKRWWKR